MDIGTIHLTEISSVLFYFFETESQYVAQTGFELLSSSGPSTLAPQNAGIIGMGYGTWPIIF